MKRGFTLIELLVVLSILTILATTAVLILNPVEYLRQSRDTKRIGDIKTIDDAVSTAIANSPNMLLGTSTVVYISIPDTATNCPTMASILPILPSGWSYYCSSVANYKKTNGTGWLPINLDSLPAKSPMATLPVDPISDASKMLYYVYTSGEKYALSATLESEKYLKQTALKDGGTNPAKIEMGSDLKLLTKVDGLVGHWPFDEGSGVVANDLSGNGNIETWNGTGVHYAAGKVGTHAGQFNGTDDYTTNVSPVNIPTGSAVMTVAAWVYPTGYPNDSYNGIVSFGTRACTGTSFLLSAHSAGVPSLATWCDDFTSAGPTLTANAWNHIVGVLSGTSAMVYVNGVAANGTLSPAPNIQNGPLNVGATDNPGRYFQGRIDDVRVYNRALSAAEVQSMYNATK